MVYKVLFTVIGLIGGILTIIKRYKYFKIKKLALTYFGKQDLQWKPKSRSEIINDLKNTNFDILIIGGGSTGMGCAIEAATRGISIGLIEAHDFGSGTSSKSTKLFHGGVRYLEKAVNDLDRSQFDLVSEALSERKIVMNMCPFLVRSMEILFPVYKRLLIPYYYIGLKFYDWISGQRSLGRSKFLSRQQTITKFPNVRKIDLVGSVSYRDGQFYDAKYNVLLGVTATYYGAVVLNHAKFLSVTKDGDKINGIKCQDSINNEKFLIRCKVLINTSGPFADEVRNTSIENCQPILQHSYGTHIIVPAIFSPKNMGFVDPSTSDGRIAFFMNFKGKTLIGGTDVKCKVEDLIKPTEEDLNFLIHEANYFTDHNLKLTKKDVLSVWTGIRPLVKDLSKSSTEKICRKHTIRIDKDNMVTVTGGKWTIFRLMGEQTINQIIKVFNIKSNRPSITQYLPVLGSQGYTKATEFDLALTLNIPEDIAKHLATTYGTKAYNFSEYFNESYTRLTDGYPYTKEEIVYCIEHELAYRISDILFNRMMIGYIDVRRAFDLIGIVAEVMKDYYGWDQQRYNEETKLCMEMMETCGYSLLKN